MGHNYLQDIIWVISMSHPNLLLQFIYPSGGRDMDDYYRIAPPNSFIHVRNFTSPKHLSEHLKYIASNDDAFNYYHQWRNEYTLAKTPKGGK